MTEDPGNGDLRASGWEGGSRLASVPSVERTVGAQQGLMAKLERGKSWQWRLEC